MANLVEAGDVHTITDSCQENTDAASSPSPSPVPMPANGGFSKDQTLFLIDLMRQHIEIEGKGLPKTLKDLNARLKSAKANKKQLWKDASEKLGSHFTQSFCPDRVARKWYTLVDAYKKVKDNNETTGKGTIRFQFYSEMNDLLGGQNDMVFPIVGTSEALEVRRPEALGHCNSVTAFADTASSPSTPTVPIPANGGFSKDQTLFLIDLIRQYIETEGEGLPKTLKDLNARLKSAKANKKLLWKDAAEKLGSHFTQIFCPDRVARKWYTLVDAYKKVKANYKTTGKGTIRFHFYSEMDDLLGGQHDVVFPVVGTSVGLEVRRPEAVGHCSSVTAFADTASSPATTPVPMPTNEGFSKDQTLFLIDLIRQHIKTESKGLPKTVKDLNARLKSGKANKKQLWKEAAEKLGSHFTQIFCPDKVARKWNTLAVAYKKVKDSNKTTGKRTIRFQFYSEMDDLLGGQHDVVFPVVGTSEGLEVRRPEAVGHCSSVTAFADTASSPEMTPTATPTPPCKRRRVDDELMQFLRESEEASQRRHEETLAQLKSAQQGFEAFMTKLLDKL